MGNGAHQTKVRQTALALRKGKKKGKKITSLAVVWYLGLFRIPVYYIFFYTIVYVLNSFLPKYSLKCKKIFCMFINMKMFHFHLRDCYKLHVICCSSLFGAAHYFMS